MHYLKTKREQIGHCNICGKVAPLTWDHVPPKGGIELTPVQMRSVFEVLTGNSEGFNVIESQNGVKYRTLCKECNQTSGSKYDTAINEFAISVGRYFKSELKLPPVVYHNTRPAALIRGILAHLVAAKIQPDQAFFDKKVVPSILDDSLPIPNDIHIFYWVFPFDFSCTVRDVAIASLIDPSKNIHYCHFIKYFPIAYLVSNKPSYEGLEELTKFRNASIKDEISIPIRLNEVKPVHWPEMADDTRIMLGGQALTNSVFATRKNTRSQA